MAKTIQKSFADFAANLELTNRQASLVSERRTNVVKTLKQKLTLHPDESKVTGS